MSSHWTELKAFRRDESLQIKSILNLDPVQLKEQGIKCIALDMDGVLVSYGGEQLNPEIKQWLNNCLTVFERGRVFILSNKSSPGRIEYFSSHFKELGVLFPKKKKPYPDGIYEIVKLTNTDPKELLVVDDRLLTGILAAIIADSQAFYVTKPLVDLSKHTFLELCFIFLRFFERTII